MKIARWFGALGFVALASLGCLAQAAEFTPEQKGAIEGIIREYLLKNPDVLQEALGELVRRQQEALHIAQEESEEYDPQSLKWDEVIELNTDCDVSLEQLLR